MVKIIPGRRSYLFWMLFSLTATALSLTLGATLTHAQRRGAIQEVSYEIGEESSTFFTLSNLEQGQTVYVYAAGASGNLDPFVTLSDTPYQADWLRETFYAEVAQAIKEGYDPLAYSIGGVLAYFTFLH